LFLSLSLSRSLSFVYGLILKGGNGGLNRLTISRQNVELFGGPYSDRGSVPRNKKKKNQFEWADKEAKAIN